MPPQSRHAQAVTPGRVVAVVAAALLVTVGAGALSRHAQAANDKAQSNAAAQKGDYTGAIEDLRQAQQVWPFTSQSGAIARDRSLLASNTYYLRGSQAFARKNWAIAVQQLQAVVPGNVHYGQARALLTTAVQRRSQFTVATKLASDLDTFQTDIAVMWADYNTQIKYLNSAWETLSGSYSLSPYATSLTNASNFSATVADAFAQVVTDGERVGEDVGALTADGVAPPPLQAGYQAMTSVLTAVQDDSNAMSDELDVMQAYANGNGTYGQMSQVSSDIAQTNKQLTAITNNLSIESSDMAEFLGTASSTLGAVGTTAGGAGGQSDTGGVQNADTTPPVKLPSRYQLPTGATLAAVNPRPPMQGAGTVQFEGATLPGGRHFRG